MVRVSIFNQDRQLQGKIKLPATSLRFLVSGLVEFQNNILKTGGANNEVNKTRAK
jgi:hypothetical protein